MVELFVIGSVCYGLSANECPGINKEHYVTYAVGAYMLVKADAIRKTTPNSKPSIEEKKHSYT